MLTLNEIVEDIIKDYSMLPEVLAITLAGSRAANRYDEHSDIDIDLFLAAPILVETRRRIAQKYSDVMEIDNQFFGTGDEFILRDYPIEIDVCLFDYEEIVSGVKAVMEDYQASTGYTTCFLHNVTNASVVFDRLGHFEAMRTMYNGQYPQVLKENIIKKNQPILRSCFSSYYHQIEKAIIRGDWNSVNHRVTAFLASYFDIIFALNEMPHPGEKRLLAIIASDCKIYPRAYDKDIVSLLTVTGTDPEAILSILNRMVDELECLLKKLNFI